MKISKKSIIIPAFALLIGASLAGSVSGTVAWYQYSTRVNAAYVGVSGGTSGNLQIRIKDGSYNEETGDWGTRLPVSDIQTYLNGEAAALLGNGSKLAPITSGAMGKTDKITNFYANPVYGQEGTYENAWVKADKSNYVVIPLQLRYVERDGVKEAGVDDKQIEKEVFLTDLLIQEDASNATNNPVKKDLSDAVRFHVNSYLDGDESTPDNHKNFLISKNGGTTMTQGKLDLDGDGVLDFKYNSDKYGFGGNAKTDLVYGEGSQIAFSSKKVNATDSYYTPDGVPGTGTDPAYSMVANSPEGSMNIIDTSKEYAEGKSKSIGSTSATKLLNVNITIWVEGWHALKVGETSNYKAMWSEEDFFNSKFDVGFEFGIDTSVDPLP